MLDVSHPYFDSSLSWLSYTHRLLMEAADESVPLAERLRFLGRFAKEKDDFIKEKIPFNRAMMLASKDTLDKLNLFPETLEQHIRESLKNQFEEFTHILTRSILPALRSEGVNLIFKSPFWNGHHTFLREYFMNNVFRHIQPVILNSRRSFKSVFPEPSVFHLIIRLFKDSTHDVLPNDNEEFLYACVNIPATQTPRFVELPDKDGVKQIAFLEDIIRFNLDIIFPGYVVFDCYCIRSEKSTQPELEDELIPLYATRVARQLEKQGFVTPQFMLFEAGMPETTRAFLVERFDIQAEEWIEKGEYLRYSDLINFPKLRMNLEYPPMPQIPLINHSENIFDRLAREDQLLHLPYHSHWPILKFFNDAAVDPFVREIHVSLYKISGHSFLVNSLLSAARNGKKVTAFVELNPKLGDQESPVWAKKMKDAGIKVIFSSPGLKVHAKIAMVKRKVKKGWERYGYLATGGFYRLTASESTDHVFLTSHSEICNELELLFAYLATGQEAKKFKYLPFNTLHVSQFNMHRRLVEMIDREIQHSKMGKKAAILIKINQLQDKQLVDKLYHASRVGVKVMVIVTNGLALIPDLPTISENITVLRVVDRFTENSRIFYFFNDGKEDVYLSSGDWTHRNFHRRIDVAFPIQNPEQKRQLIQMLENYLNDNQKAVRLDVYHNNVSLKDPDALKKIRAQEANYKLIQQLSLKAVLS